MTDPSKLISQINEDDRFHDTTVCPLRVLNWIIDCKMIDIFTNIYISYRLLLTIPIANSESERSFPVLKRSKDMLGPTMGDETMGISSLARLNSESEILESLDLE